MHKVFCIIGRTASGKSTITRKVSENMGLKILKSYTTREMRENETVETTDHTHIPSNAVINYKDEMVAYTERVGYCSFATERQLVESDLYIINPSGYYDLALAVSRRELDVELIPVFITVPYKINRQRAVERGDYLSWIENYEKESKEFDEFKNSDLIRYRVLNDCSIDEAAVKLENIIRKELDKVDG